MKKVSFIKKYTKDRAWYINLLWCIFSLVGVVLVPSLIYLMLKGFIHNEHICDIISNIIFIAILVLIYYKDLVNEFKIFKSNIKTNIKDAFKYYIVGIMAMIFFNLIIVVLLKNISTNEDQVRELLYSAPVFTLISIIIIAPLKEELVFRKSIQPVIKNKYIYALVCGVLFGFAHILTNILGGTFALKDLLYIIPYGSLGYAFAMMDNKSKSTFSSIMIHAFHNCVTGILLLIVYKSGV